MTRGILSLLARLVLLVAPIAAGNNYEYYNYDDYNANKDDDNVANQNDDYRNGDDGRDQYDNEYKANNNQADGDYIKYWTDYAILPKRCIVYDGVDMIVFSIFEEGYKQCSDEPRGTYMATTIAFIQGYLDQKQADMSDQGNDDYAGPDVAQYLSCTPYQVDNQQYYLQIGCSDQSTQMLAVNTYIDDACTNRFEKNGSDDAAIDVSEIGLQFKKCQACVNWFDRQNNDDDYYFEQHQTQAPFCSTAWTYKEECGKKCQHTGVEKKKRPGWNTSDKILLSILSFFAFVMLGLIIRKRYKMSNKDALLEQAAMSAAGLQQPHVIGMFVLSILVIAVFALLGLKDITWALLLIVNTILFGYLMKLTVDSSVSSAENIIGPDGTILRRDSDDSSMEESKESSRRNTGATFVLPTLA